MTVSGKKIAQRVLPARGPAQISFPVAMDLRLAESYFTGSVITMPVPCFEAGFDADAAAMRFDDATDDGQAKSGALGFGRAQARR